MFAVLVVAALGSIQTGPVRAQDAKDAEALNAQVIQLYRAGKFAQAIPLAERALSIREKALGADHPDVATALNNLALLYRNQGRYPEAEPLYKRSLAIDEKALGADHPDVATDLNNLAALYQAQGRTPEAEPLFKRSLAIREKALGADHPDVATALNNLAELYRNQGRYPEAEPLYKRSLAIREKALGADHPLVATALNNLALLYRAQGRYPEAEPLYKRSLAIDEKALGADHPSVATALNNLALLYRAQGRYPEAEPLYKRSLAIDEKALGADHPSVATALNNLAGLYDTQGRYPEAEPLYKRSLAIRERALGADHPSVATALNNLAELYRAQGRYPEAEPLYQRSLAIDEKALGADHPDVATDLNNLAGLYQAQGRYPEAEPLYKRSLAIRERALGADHPDVAAALNNLAELYRAQGRYPEAEPLYQRSLAIDEKALGADHPDVATDLNNLAGLYQAQGRYPEAEPLYKRSLAIDEKALGADHPDVATDLNNLAELYQAQGRYPEAEPLYKRSLAIDEKALGADHPDVATDLNNLAALYQAQGRYPEAEPLMKRSLAIWEKALGADHPDVATALNNLAELYRNQGRYPEAEPLYKRSLAIREKALGADHPDVAQSLNNLALLYQNQGRYPEAEPLYKRSLAIDEKALGADHPSVATALNNLAGLYLVQSDWAQAENHWRRATTVLTRRAERGVDIGQALTGKRQSETQANDWYFWSLVKAANRHAAADRGREPALAREMFETAQWVRSSEAAAALTEMAARGTKGDLKLAEIVRERHDLVDEWQKRDQARSAFASQAPDKRDRTAETANVARLSAIDARVAEIDLALAKDFPDYATLVSPKPLGLADTQAALRPDEALILTLDTPERKPTPEETFVWVVTKTELRWVRSEMGTASLQREVAALRCGLDYDGSWAIKDSPCPALTKTSYTENDHRTGKPLPFDLTRAHALYKALFGEAQDLIKDKHLLIVPSGALTQLPFQVLVTAQPAASVKGAEAFRQAKWLVRDHAITVLPSVASLKALRRDAKPSRAAKAMIGFGNPLLDGVGQAEARRAEQARANTACPVKPLQVASLRRAIAPLELRGGLADVAFLRSAPPLPETADELCAVAANLKVGNADIYLGPRATVPEVTRLNASGDLAKYRLIHFATHGALSGQVTGSSEPGLILTPPNIASEADDGYLSASKIAALKLDADWVILSACNTVAGGSSDAEALSGLARAFFYAGARALLVSHWSVNSNATVKLITGAINRMSADTSVGRAEALRQSMLTLMSTGTDTEAQPANWAPFIVVGEGAAAR